MTEKLITGSDLQRYGFCILPRAVVDEMVRRLLAQFDNAFAGDSQSILARSNRGHVYAARNLIGSIPEVSTVWQLDPMMCLLREVLGSSRLKPHSSSLLVRLKRRDYPVYPENPCRVCVAHARQSLYGPMPE